MEHYKRSLVSISPLEWYDAFTLDFENIFTQIELVGGSKKKSYGNLVAHTCRYKKLGSYHFLPGEGISVCDGQSIFSGPPPLLTWKNSPKINLVPPLEKILPPS